jgi:hypothetical protein
MPHSARAIVCKDLIRRRDENAADSPTEMVRLMTTADAAVRVNGGGHRHSDRFCRGSERSHAQGDGCVTALPLWALPLPNSMNACTIREGSNMERFIAIW